MTNESDNISDKVMYSNTDSKSTDPRSIPEQSIVDSIVDNLKTHVDIGEFIESDIHRRLEIIEGMFYRYEEYLRIEPMRIPKSSDESYDYEEAAMRDDIKGNYNNAIFLYNMSIAFAEDGYQHLHRLYEKRATALLQMKLYKASLHSLELAIKYCPSDLDEKYKKQKENFIRIYNASQSTEERIISECQTDINSLTKIEDDRKHPNAPFIANCLEVRDVENYGRGIFTNCDLIPGDVVAIDRAYASILYTTYQYRHCSNCFKENWSLIPCPGCTTAMYCNEKCLQIAWKKFHKHECDISNYLFELFPKDDMMWFRVPLQTIELFGGIDPLIEFEETPQQIDIRTFRAFNVDHDDDGEVVHHPDNLNFISRMTVSNYYPVHEIIRDVQAPSTWPIDMYLSTAIFTLLIYRLFEGIFNITTDNQKLFAQKFIYRHILAARLYNYELYVRRTKRDIICYGSAIFPFAALINHSCAPNIIFDKNGSSGTMIVAHPIKAGEQLFYSYGPHYSWYIKLIRQFQLETAWGFVCQCTACTEDYLLSDELPTNCIPDEGQMVPPINLKLRKLIDDIKALYTIRCSHLKLYPSAEICYYETDATRYLSQLLRRLSGSVYMNC